MNVTLVTANGTQTFTNVEVTSDGRNVTVTQDSGQTHHFTNVDTVRLSLV